MSIIDPAAARDVAPFKVVLSRQGSRGERDRYAKYYLYCEVVELISSKQVDSPRELHLSLYERLPFAAVFRVLRLRQDGLQLYIRAYCSLLAAHYEIRWPAPHFSPELEALGQIQV